MPEPARAHRNALPPGCELLWYRIGDVLGQGAFGITYLAQDINLNRQVAIKEFLPGQLARREDDQSVQPLSSELSEEFSWGLERFISEGRTLAKFEHHNIVRVHNVFESNSTAYMVMNYEEGNSLDAILRKKRTLAEHEILQLVFPLLSGLEQIHSAGFVHRDIKPGNIFIRKDGTPVLLDFGSARQAIQNHTRTLTNFVSPGYAPIEQYTSKSDKQGPWSDIYGLGATLYRATTGQAPVDAVERGESLAADESDTFQMGAVQARGRYSKGLLDVIDRALAFKITDRPQTVVEWRQEFELVAANVSEAPTIEVPSPDSPSAQTEQILPSGSMSAPTETVTEFAEPKTVDVVDTAINDAADYSKKRSTLLRNSMIGALVGVLAIGAFIFIDRGDVPLFKTPVLARAPVASVPAGPSVAEQVAKLLTAAAADAAALRLTTPAGNNAYEKYREALTLDPGNRDALAGITSIVDRYLGLAYRDIEDNNLERAQGYLNKAEAVSPGRESVAKATQALADKARYNKSFKGKMKNAGKSIGDFFKGE